MDKENDLGSEYVCKVCQRRGCYFYPGMADEKGLDVEQPITIPVFIGRFGCASHTDFPNEKETINGVLDDIEHKIAKIQFTCADTANDATEMIYATIESYRLRKCGKR